MAYGSAKGRIFRGDIYAEDDPNQDTYIDWGNDFISFGVGGVKVLNVSASDTLVQVLGNVSASGNITGSNFHAHGIISASSNITASGHVSASAFYGDGRYLVGLSSAGSNQQIQFNDGGAFGADSSLQWAATPKLLIVTGTVSASSTLISKYVTASTHVSATTFYGDGQYLKNTVGTPGGTNGLVQFNQAGAFAGAGDLKYQSGRFDIGSSGFITACTGALHVTGAGMMGFGSLFSVGNSNSTSGSFLMVSGSGLVHMSGTVTISGSLSSSANVTASGHVSASAFYGDGQYLKNVGGGSGGGIFTTLGTGNAYTTSSLRVGAAGEPAAILHVDPTSSTTGSTFFQISDPSPSTPVNANPLTTAQMAGILLKVTGSGFIFGEQNTFFDYGQVQIGAQDSGYGRLELGTGSVNDGTAKLHRLIHNNSNQAFEIWHGDATANNKIFTLTSASVGNSTLHMSGNISASSNITASGHVSASFFYGDGQYLKNVGGGATPGGSNTNIQFNNAGAFGGDSKFCFQGDRIMMSGSISGSGQLIMSGAQLPFVKLGSNASSTYTTYISASILSASDGFTISPGGRLILDGSDFSGIGGINLRNRGDSYGYFRSSSYNGTTALDIYPEGLLGVTMLTTTAPMGITHKSFILDPTGSTIGGVSKGLAIVSGSLTASHNISASAFYGTGAHLSSSVPFPTASLELVFGGGGGRQIGTRIQDGDDYLAIQNANGGTLLSASAGHEVMGGGDDGMALFGVSGLYVYGDLDGDKLSGSILKSGAISGSALAIAGNITASGHVSASAFYGDGQYLKNVGGGTSIFTPVSSKEAYTTSSIRVGGTGRPSASVYISSSEAGALFRIDTKDNTVSNETVLFVTASGRVGIGTKLPSTMLEIEDTSSAMMTFDRTGTNGRNWEMGSADYGFVLFDRSEGSTSAYRMVVSDGAAGSTISGNIGLGTGPGITTPRAQLHVSASGLRGAKVLQVDSGLGIPGTPMLFVSGAGTIGINTRQPAVALDVHYTGTASPVTLLDDKGGGEVVYFGTSSASGLQPGALYYLNESGGWASSSAATASAGPRRGGSNQLLGISLGTNPSQDGMLIRGYFHVDAYFTGPGFKKGRPIYMATSSAKFQSTTPTASGNFVRVLGYATDTGNVIYFNPDSTYIELA